MLTRAPSMLIAITLMEVICVGVKLASVEMATTVVSNAGLYLCRYRRIHCVSISPKSYGYVVGTESLTCTVLEGAGLV